MTKITFWIATKITTKERERYLYKAIESILFQNNSNWELLISDDNSDIRPNYEKYNDDRIKIFYQKKSLWIFKNFNFCLNNTKTELFLPLWDDDLLENNFVEKILGFYNKNIDFIAFNYKNIKANWKIYYTSNIPESFYNKWQDFLNYSIKELYWEWEKKMFFCSVIKTKSLKKIWWYPDYWMITDTYLVYLFSNNFNCWFCNDNLIKIRHHDQNASWIEKVDILRKEQILLYKRLKNDFYSFLSEENRKIFDKNVLTLCSDHISLLIKFKEIWRLGWIKFFLEKWVSSRKIIVLFFWILFWKNNHYFFIKFINIFNRIKQFYINLVFNKF